jgi:hypothetical protein
VNVKRSAALKRARDTRVVAAQGPRHRNEDRLMLHERACRRWIVAAIGLLFGILAIAASSVQADARNDYLIRLLKDSTQFRVRAQAAISLGGVDAATGVVEALTTALADEHPAVRAAAANSLGRLADPKSLRALRSASSDPEPPVRSAVSAAIAKIESAARQVGSQVEIRPTPTGPARYYVALGRPASRAPDVSIGDLDQALQVLRDRLATIDGVVIAPVNESPSQVRSVLRARNLRGFYLESAVTSLEQKPGGGVRVAVSLIVATYPDRAMRAIMQGAATAMGGGDSRSQAMMSAFRSALNQLPAAMARE